MGNCFCKDFPANIYLFKGSDRNIRKTFKKLKWYGLRRPYHFNFFKGCRRRSAVFIVNFEHISHLFLMFLLLTLNK